MDPQDTQSKVHDVMSILRGDRIHDSIDLEQAGKSPAPRARFRLDVSPTSRLREAFASQQSRGQGVDINWREAAISGAAWLVILSVTTALGVFCYRLVKFVDAN
jgi:hypothetical protein